MNLYKFFETNGQRYKCLTYNKANKTSNKKRMEYNTVLMYGVYV